MLNEPKDVKSRYRLLEEKNTGTEDKEKGKQSRSVGFELYEQKHAPNDQKDTHNGRKFYVIGTSTKQKSILSHIEINYSNSMLLNSRKKVETVG